MPEHLGVVDSIVDHLNKNKKQKIFIQVPDILPHFETHMSRNFYFGQRAFQIVPPNHNIVVVVPRYEVDLAEQIIASHDYFTRVEDDALSQEMIRMMYSVRDLNSKIKMAMETANLKIRSTQQRRADVIRLEMLTEDYEEIYATEIAEIIESYAMNIQIWHGTQQINIERILRIRRRQSMLLWFRKQFYPVTNQPPPQFQGRNMYVHLNQNPLSELERRFVNDPTVANIPSLIQLANVVQPHTFSNRNIIDAMMGVDAFAHNLSNEHENIYLSIARGSVGDYGFRLRQLENLPATTQRPTRAPRPTRFPRKDLK
jgi:hypothetical protein